MWARTLPSLYAEREQVLREIREYALDIDSLEMTATPSKEWTESIHATQCEISERRDLLRYINRDINKLKLQQKEAVQPEATERRPNLVQRIWALFFR